MITNRDIDRAIARVLSASTSNFVELAKIAGLNPARDFRHANLSGIDFAGSKLAGFDFSGSSFEGATFVNSEILGATFTRSAELDLLLYRAADAEEVLGRRRRRRRRRGRLGTRGIDDVSSQEDVKAEFPDYISAASIEVTQLDDRDVGGDTRELETLSAVLSWLDERPTDRSAAQYFYYLADHHDLFDTAERAHRWLQANLDSAHASQVLSLLLRLQGWDEQTQSLAIRWLQIYPSDPQAKYLFCSLLRSSTSSQILELAFKWLEFNYNGAVSVLTALVVAAGFDMVVRDRALKWIDQNLTAGSVPDLLVNLLKSGHENEVRMRCLAWLDKNPTSHAATALLIALLRGPGFDDGIKRRVFRWIDSNWKWAHSAHVISHLAQIREPDEDVLAYVRRWSDSRSNP